MQWRLVLKLMVLGGVALVLMIVLVSIDGLTQERKWRLNEVEQDIANSYAGEQQMGGPVFKVTFREFWTEHLYNEEKDSWYDKEMNAVRSQLVFPDECRFAGSMAVQERTRGIFKANVFQSEGRVTGRVHFPSFDSLARLKDSRLELVSVDACFMISDPRGLPSIPTLQWNNESLAFESGSLLAGMETGIHAELPDAAGLFGNTFPFSTDLQVNGTRQLQFIPTGSENHVALKSGWPHPSFVGQFLADERTVSDKGFSATWNVNALASSAQQDIERGKGHAQSFGVSLIDPVGLYSLTDRALKYGFLFIFITFSAFFLFEMLEDLRIHPVQYGFVGLAQAIFFLLLLSLSEHMGFGISYGIASLGTIGLITYYLCHVMRGWKRGLSFGTLMALLYGVLYVLLQSEDHALVAGSILLFGLMTVVMMITRKVDWYALGSKPAGTVQ